MTISLDSVFFRQNLPSRGAEKPPVRRRAAPPPERPRRPGLGRSPWLRTVLSSLFILFMLAAAHLFMVVVNAAEAAVAAPSPADGQPARIFSDRPMTEEIERALQKAKAPEDVAALEAALATARSGQPVALRTLPVTDFLAWSAIGLSALGLFLVWITSRFKSDAVQSIVGIFGGNMLWTGGIEYGLMAASRSLGIGKTIHVENGELVAIYGEYVLLKYTWGALLLIMAYLLFLDSSRCPMFLWWRKRLPVMRGSLASGRIGNYGPRSAFQYATTVWALYLLLLWAYDENVFGVYSLVTKGILFGSVAATLYCLVRLHKQPGWGPSVRYAVAAICIAWTPIEIFAKWGVMREPWLLLEPGTSLLFFGGLALGTWALWRAQRRSARDPRVEGASGARDEAAATPHAVA